VHSRVSGRWDTAADGENSVCGHWVIDAGVRGDVGGDLGGCWGVDANWLAWVFRGHWADCCGDSNGRGNNGGRVSRAVGDRGSAASDCNQLGGVDGRGGIHWCLGGGVLWCLGGHWLSCGVGDGRVSWAVIDGRGARGDGHNFS